MKYAIYLNFIYLGLCINSAYGDACDRLFRDSKSTSTALVRTSPTRSLAVPNQKHETPGFLERRRQNKITTLIEKNIAWKQSLESLYKLYQVSSDALLAYEETKGILSQLSVFQETYYYIFEGKSERFQGTQEPPIQRYSPNIGEDLFFVINAASSINYQVGLLLEDLRSSKANNKELAQCFESVDTFLQATNWQLHERAMMPDRNPLLEAAGFYQTFERRNVEIHVARFEELILERFKRINQQLVEMKEAYASIPMVKAEHESRLGEMQEAKERARQDLSSLTADYNGVLTQINLTKDEMQLLKEEHENLLHLTKQIPNPIKEEVQSLKSNGENLYPDIRSSTKDRDNITRLATTVTTKYNFHRYITALTNLLSFLKRNRINNIDSVDVLNVIENKLMNDIGLKSLTPPERLRDKGGYYALEEFSSLVLQKIIDESIDKLADWEIERNLLPALQEHLQRYEEEWEKLRANLFTQYSISTGHTHFEVVIHFLFKYMADERWDSSRQENARIKLNQIIHPLRFEVEDLYTQKYRKLR